MNLIVWLIVGGLVGAYAGWSMRAARQQSIHESICVGIAGALIGGYLMSPMGSAATFQQQDFSLLALITSVIGSAILLTLVNLLRHPIARRW